MLIGTIILQGVQERSTCRLAEDAFLNKVGDYKIHSTTLIPNSPFERAITKPNVIDDSIFINADNTTLRFSTVITTQNYLTTRYIGKVPFEYYAPYDDPRRRPTRMGAEFQLICKNGNPNYDNRIFGTEWAILGYNP